MSDKLNLIETISKEDKWSVFSRIMGTSGANAIFTGDGGFTVFAPTNDAFGKIPDAKMNELLNEPDQLQLRALLSYHIVPGKLMSANLPASITRKSVTGGELTFSDTNGLKVNGAIVQARNIEASDGVIHQIDTVLAPPTTKAAAVSGTSNGTKETPVAITNTPLETPAAQPALANKATTIL